MVGLTGAICASQIPCSCSTLVASGLVNGTWEMVAEVTDNSVRTRGHSFSFSGKSWLKMVVTAAKTGENEVKIDELAVYDISASGNARPQDTWLFFGDSITKGAFNRDLGTGNNFDERITARFPA